MNSENLIGVNVANGVSILVMGAIGALILMALRKAAAGRSQAVSNAPIANSY